MYVFVQQTQNISALPNRMCEERHCFANRRAIRMQRSRNNRRWFTNVGYYKLARQSKCILFQINISRIYRVCASHLNVVNQHSPDKNPPGSLWRILVLLPRRVRSTSQFSPADDVGVLHENARVTITRKNQYSY
jgi:hypothetical protein